MTHDRPLLISIFATLLVSCGTSSAPKDPIEPPDCSEIMSALQCLDSASSCDWFNTGCEAERTAMRPTLGAQYESIERTFPAIDGVKQASFSVYELSDGEYVGLLAVETNDSAVLWPADVRVTPGGALLIETADVECLGSHAACTDLGTSRFAGRIDETAITLTEWDDQGIDLRFVPHNGVKPAPAEQNPPPIDPDPIAGKYGGSIYTRTDTEFVRGHCSFVISVDADGAYFVEEAVCPLGNYVSGSFTGTDDANEFSFQLSAGSQTYTLVGDRAIHASTEFGESYALRGAVVLGVLRSPEIATESMAGTFVLEEEGVRR